MARPPFSRSVSSQAALAFLACLSTTACFHVHAQSVANPAATAQANSTPSITITGRASANNAAGVAGFGDVPLAQSPYSGSVITRSQLQDAGIASLGDITRLDAGTTDAYNAPGYWGQLAVRGYVLDARFNFRRDSLPINAETALFTGNKQALELIKGTSGLQAGTSTPGGLVNLVVKRPSGSNFVDLGTSVTGSGNLAFNLDANHSNPTGVGWRVNAEAEQLRPALRSAKGQRQLLAGAAESTVGSNGLLEAEVEFSHQSQPSMPGFSLLGPRLAAASSVDPNTNLNNQTWSLPVVFKGSTASLRYTHKLDGDWQAVAHLQTQQLRTEDRVAFPFGCSAEDNYTRYCSDGSFDFYDYRSEGERRNTTAADLSASGSMVLAGVQHHLGVGLLSSRFAARFNAQAYNWVGFGRVDGSASVPPDPTPIDPSTNRNDNSTELRVQDRVALTANTQLWAGLRHTRLQRDSVRTDGSRPSDYSQSFTTPWLGLTHELHGGLMAYANTGSGVESEVAPNRSRYNNPGQPLPALKSHQVEVGLKQRKGSVTWNLAAFDLKRPLWADLGSCDDTATCTRQHSGWQRHRGLEGDAEWSAGAFSLRGSAMLLRARVQGTADPSLNGQQPTNVPKQTLKVQAAYNLAAVPGLALLAFATHEGARMVLPDNSVATPGWTRLDLGARYATKIQGLATTWRLGVDNATDQRAWKEAPNQYGHAYLYPLPARQWHASVQIKL